MATNGEETAAGAWAKNMSASLCFAPMPLAVLDEPFDHDGFIFELKYDGFRALADVGRGRCRLISRNHHEFTTFPELCAAIGQAETSSPAWAITSLEREMW